MESTTAIPKSSLKKSRIGRPPKYANPEEARIGKEMNRRIRLGRTLSKIQSNAEARPSGDGVVSGRSSKFVQVPAAGQRTEAC